MKRVVSEIAVAVVGGVLTFVVFDLVADASALTMLVVAGVVTLLALALIVLLGDNPPSSQDGRDVTVGDDIRAKGDLSVEDVTVRGPSRQTRVGTRLRSRGTVTIKGVDIDSDEADG